VLNIYRDFPTPTLLLPFRFASDKMVFHDVLKTPQFLNGILLGRRQGCLWQSCNGYFKSCIFA